ncbi:MULTISPECIES: hypothetical protein [Alphaproteobacteria]|uniref:hypothetical protein n=1 Tax=Alphaproteobacteria TaxID=28211 RepID=UPI00326367FC
MSETTKRHQLDADPVEVLYSLPTMDRLMTALRADGFLFERLGPVEEIKAEEGVLRIAGACQNLALDTTKLSQVHFDTSSQMRGKIYPRFDFLAADESVLFSVIGLEGLDPFEKALSGYQRIPVEARPRPKPSDEEPDLQNDPAGSFLESLVDGPKVTVTATTPAATQSWTGKITEVRPAGGCFNLLVKDFHLHLPAACLGGWKQNGKKHQGILLDGSPSALEIEIQP